MQVTNEYSRLSMRDLSEDLETADGRLNGS